MGTGSVLAARLSLSDLWVVRQQAPYCPAGVHKKTGDRNHRPPPGGTPRGPGATNHTGTGDPPPGRRPEPPPPAGTATRGTTTGKTKGRAPGEDLMASTRPPLTALERRAATLPRLGERPGAGLWVRVRERRVLVDGEALRERLPLLICGELNSRHCGSWWPLGCCVAAGQVCRW